MVVCIQKKNYGKKLTAYRGLGMERKEYKIKLMVDGSQVLSYNFH